MAHPHDKRFYQLTLAIQKAINAIETPVKEKHVRSTIIGTFQEQSAITYWMVAIRLPIQDNRIVAWKFCHVTHKLLREGHPACLDDSQRHIGMIENLGKLWVHLREGYGKLVHLYCNLLVCKLKFHSRNPRFPGNLQLTADELDAIAENDVNNYFQLCVELFDYMEDILNLQAAVFDSLGNARANSMTASGQCRLAALIPCAQDASQIYDCNVRLLFRLHASLPPDTLAGHRERFRQQFKKLSSFYKHASSLQYYRNLLTLPVLPSNPPNFLQQSDFGTYVTPVVTIPDMPPDEVDSVGSLIDTSDTLSQAPSEPMEDFDARPTPSPQPDPIVERDRLIDHLQNELKRMRSDVAQVVQERNSVLVSMKEHCTRLESQLQAAQVELEEEKQKAEMLSVQTPEIKQKLTDTEEKAKIQDEKFQKLKGAYTQLREEHIALIRQKAEVDKQSTHLKAATVNHESDKLALQQQLNDALKEVELLQQNIPLSEEVESYKDEITYLRGELENERQKQVELENLQASMQALEIEHNASTKEQEEKLATLMKIMKETNENLKQAKEEKEALTVQVARLKEDMIGLTFKTNDEYKRLEEEKNSVLSELIKLKEEYQAEKEAESHMKKNTMTELHNIIDSLQKKIIRIDFEKETKCQNLTDAIVKQVTSDCDKRLKDRELKIGEMSLNIENLQNSLKVKTHEAIVNKQSADELAYYRRSNERENSALMSQLDLITDKLQQRKTAHARDQELLIAKNAQYKRLEVKYKFLEYEMTRLVKDLKEAIYIGTRATQELQTCEKRISRIIEQPDIIDDTDKRRSQIDSKNLRDYMSLLQQNTNAVKQMETFSSGTKMPAFLQQYEQKMKNYLSDYERINQEVRDDMKMRKMFENVGNPMITLHPVTTTTTGPTTTTTELEPRENVFVQRTDRTDDGKLCEPKDPTIKRLEALLELKNGEYKILHASQTKLRKENSLCQTSLNMLKEEHKRVVEEYKSNLDVKDEEFRELNQKYSEVNSKQTQLLIKYKKINSAFATAKKTLDNRIEHVESKRLNAECELQDLLQHNTVLEADLAAAKKQLEDTQKALEKQTSRLVNCAGEVAVEVTTDALTAFENSNAHDNISTAAGLAAKALEQLAGYSDVSGNEESIAKSAMFVAHNTAQLSVYVADVSNVSTDVKLSEQLNNQCRTMLAATKACLESIKSGTLESASCLEAQSQVKATLSSTEAADRHNSGSRSVDDELADMDRAIEEAASQIESMLAATRASDSGVKLEVNGKILDACTTLMGAVKILVQDARKLQNELGDPKTRQKMYRKNPQWSEGLISAAKAVVFAAKLLVTSADEAVNTVGQTEGVSAAAHEVAGSTAQLVAASRTRAAPGSPALERLTRASRHVAAATGALVGAVKAGSALVLEQEALDTSSLSLTATRRLEMESKVRSLKLETALDAERARLSALRKRHYQLAQLEENGNVENGKD